MSLGFRARLLLAAALPAVMVALLLAIAFIDRQAAELEDSLRDQGWATAKQLGMAAEFPLFAGNLDALDRLVAAAQKGDRQIRAVAVTERNGEIRSRVGQFSMWTSDWSGSEHVIDGTTTLVVVPINRSKLSVDNLFEDALPPPEGQSQELLGYAVVELSRHALEAQRKDMLVRTIAIAVGGLLLAALLSTFIAGSVTRPLALISQVVARIKGGELGARAATDDTGVMAPLAAGINDMAERIAFTQEDLRRQIASATAELRQQKDVAERAARVDALTGVANRRAFAEIAEAEVQRALRYGTPVSLMLIDVDHFKSINDQYGHPTGDAALANFARILLQAVREVDVVGRWGGEEFVILLPGTDAAEALPVAERMRAATADCRLQVEGRQILYTASFGVAEFHPDDAEFYRLLARADEALYQAKNLGRDRVVLAAGPGE